MRFPARRCTVLGSLLRGHHNGSDLKKQNGLSHLMPLVMYADNADSLYTKGSEAP